MGPGDNDNITIVLGSDDDDLRKAIESSLGVPVMTISEFAEDCNTHETGDSSNIRVSFGNDEDDDSDDEDKDDLPW